MALILFSRTGVNLDKGKGEILGLCVPSADQIQVYRDVGSSGAEIAQRSGAGSKSPLWREEGGETIVYGMLPTEMAQRRQALKVWLASDYAPPDAEAFFFLFDKRWIVHGIQETDDEGRRKWRSTILSYPEDQIFTVTADSAADLMLGSNKRNIIIAVDEDLGSYGRLKELLAPMGLSPVPFSTLKPSPRARILYRHRDYTLPMLVSVFFLILIVFGTLFWWFNNSMELSNYEERVVSVRRQIGSIQINDSIGHIRQPEGLLNAMKRPFAQQPSAILDAAARLGAQFGDVANVKFNFQPEAGPEDQRLLEVEISKPKQSLLVGQEAVAKALLPNLPWVKDIANVSPPNSGQIDLNILLQIETPPGDGSEIPEISPTEIIVGEDGLPVGTVIPSLTEIASSTEVSGTTEDSATLATTSEAGNMVSTTTQAEGGR